MSAISGGFRPSLGAVSRLVAEGHRIVPIWSEMVADVMTPVGAFMAVVGDRDGFLLESVEGGERWGRYSFVGCNPLATVNAWGAKIELTGRIGPEAVQGAKGVFGTLGALLDTYRCPDAPEIDELVRRTPLHGGMVGWIGYDVVREVEKLPCVPPDDQGLPDAWLAVIGQLCVFDHWRQRVVLIENVLFDPPCAEDDVRDAYEAACSRLEDLSSRLMKTQPGPLVPVAGIDAASGAEILSELERTMTSEQFCQAVAVAKERIAAGDIFQVVLSQRFDLKLGAEPFDLYRVLRLINPSPYLYFLRTEHATVVGSSPEPMVRLRDGKVISRPIAGTRPRGASDEEDRRLAAELLEDPKELAEHVMLVDLARNDVGRVVEFGTEHVDELMVIERYSHVMHLTSQVSGTLAQGKSTMDALKATLPAGTLSGAPKVRAMQIIDELEPTKRGIYGGVVGYLDFSGNLDTAIAIRTMVIAPDGRASVQAGAGIVSDSDPAKEDRECANKAAALLSAVPGARLMSAARAQAAARVTPQEPSRGK